MLDINAVDCFRYGWTKGSMNVGERPLDLGRDVYGRKHQTCYRGGFFKHFLKEIERDAPGYTTMTNCVGT